MRDRKKGGFLLAAGGIFAAVNLVIREGQLLCEYSAFMGNSMGSNRSFAAERIFLL